MDTDGFSNGEGLGWLSLEQAVRSEDRAVRDMSGYWLGVEAEVPSGSDLLGALVLTGANCFPDSRYESWYALPEPVDHLDLSAVFDEGGVIHEVNFDG